MNRANFIRVFVSSVIASTVMPKALISDIPKTYEFNICHVYFELESRKAAVIFLDNLNDPKIPRYELRFKILDECNKGHYYMIDGYIEIDSDLAKMSRNIIVKGKALFLPEEDIKDKILEHARQYILSQPNTVKIPEPR